MIKNPQNTLIDYFKATPYGSFFTACGTKYFTSTNMVNNLRLGVDHHENKTRM
jgi:hypothetical protein